MMEQAWSPRPRSRRKPIALFAATLLVVGTLAWLLRPTLPSPRITGSTQITHDGQQKSFTGQVTRLFSPMVLASSSRKTSGAASWLRKSPLREAKPYP